MRRLIIVLSFALFVAAQSPLLAQSNASKIGLGFNIGGQRIYGDRPEELFGVGGEGVVSYRIAPFADIALALGYGQLKYNFVPGTPTSTTDMLNADLKGNLEVISKGVVRPFVTVGLGLVNYTIRNSGFKRANDAVFFGGGGVKFFVNPLIDLYAGADYRFSTGDTFDNVVKEGSANDGFLNIRTGMTYYLGGGRREEPQYIAEERAPFVELQEDPYAYQDDYQQDPGYPEQQPQSQAGQKSMEEYVKLKSRMDQLVGSLGSNESEIAELQQELNNRKRRLSTMKQKASTQPPKQIRTSSSMSGFADIYQEGLTNFYNKNYSEAVSLFRLLLQQYSDHSLAGSCQFWIGQSLYAMQRYEEAADAFYKVLSFERSLKKDDALFHLGKTYLKLGSAERARESFARLVQDYPGSEFVDEAKNYVARL